MDQNFEAAIAAIQTTSDRQPLPHTIAFSQSHNSHIPKPATTLAQSQGAGNVPPTQLHKKGSTLTRKCCYVVAQVLSRHTRQEISSDEIEAIAVQRDTLWVKLTNGWDAPIHTDTFRQIRRLQLEEQARVEAEMDVAAVLRQLAQPLADAFDHSEPSSEQMTASSPDKRFNSPDNSPRTPDIRIEVDGKRHPVYTVWSDQEFLGSFHQSLVDGKWLTNPMYRRDYCRHETQGEAVVAIATAWNHAQQLRAADQGLMEVQF